ncbi:hypothetical protein Avbf_09906 [Armadillidium vulgare]|nr:hypothetical protein Avbf_09906 [Armadillidium vulgare]
MGAVHTSCIELYLNQHNNNNNACDICKAKIPVERRMGSFKEYVAEPFRLKLLSFIGVFSLFMWVNFLYLFYVNLKMARIVVQSQNSTSLNKIEGNNFPRLTNNLTPSLNNKYFSEYVMTLDVTLPFFYLNNSLCYQKASYTEF